MTKYNIEGGIDFFSELYKSLDIEENNQKIEEDNNLCLITNQPLVDKHVKLECGHKFNYIPLFNDIKNHKQKFNNLEGCNSKLKLPYVPSISSNNNINAMCFIKDRLVCGSGDNTVSIWDLTNNACIFILIGHTSSVNDVCIFGNKN